MTNWYAAKPSGGYQLHLLERIDLALFEAEALRDWAETLVAWIRGEP